MHKLPKILQIFSYVVFGVLILFIGLSFFATPIAQWYLEKQVKGVGNGQYTLQFTHFNLSLLQGKLHLSGIHLTTDTVKAGTDPFVDGQVDEVIVGGFAYLDFFLENELNLNRLGLKGGNINIKLTSSQGKQKPEQPFKLQQLDIYPEVKNQFDQLSVGNISLEDLEIHILQEEGNHRIRYKGRLANIRSESILIEDNSLITDSRSFYAESHELVLTDQHIWLVDTASQTEVRFDTLSLQIEENLLSFYLTPGYLLKERRKPDTILFAHSGAFEIEKLNLFRLQEDNSASIEGGSLSGFRYYQPSYKPKQTSSTEQENDEMEAFNIKQLSLGTYLPAFVERVRLEELNVENTAIELTGFFAFKEGSVRAKEVIIDGKSAFANDKFLHSSQLQAELHQVNFITRESPHRISLSSFLLEAKNGKGSLKVDELGIQPFEKGKLENVLNGEVALIAFHDFNTRELPAGVFSLEKLSIENPNANLRICRQLIEQRKEEKKEQEPFNLGKLDLYPLIQDQLKRISIRNLQLNNLSGSIHIRNEQNETRISTKALQFESEDLLIAANELFTKNRTFYSEKTRLEGHQIHVSNSGRENWQVKAKLFEMNSQKEKFFVSTQSGYFLQTGEQKGDTLLFYGLDQIDLSDLELHQLQEKGTASIQGFSLTGVEFVTEENLLQKGKSFSTGFLSEETKDPFSEFSLGKKLPHFIDEILLEEFNLEIIKGRGPEFFLKEGKARAKGLKLDKEPAFVKERFLHFTTIDTEVEQLELEGGDPLHQLNLSSFHFNVTNGVGKISSQLTIKPQDIKSRFVTWLDAEIPLLELRNFDTRGVSSGNFSLDTLLIYNPKVVLHPAENYGQKEEDREDTVGLDFYPQIEEKLERATLKSLQVRGGDIRLSGMGGSYYGVHVPELSAEVSDIDLGKNTAFANGRILHASAIRLSMNNLLYLLPDNVYRLQLDELHLNTRHRKMEIEGLNYGYSENYEKKLDGEKKNELYRIRNKSLKAEEVQWDELLQRGTFIVDKITSENLELYVYKDLNKPESGKTKPLPNEMVAELGFPLFIDSLAMQDMEVRYEEKAEGAEIPGLVDITDMEVLIQNITNIENKVAQNPEMRMMGNGRIMGKGYFETIITVPLQENGKNIRVEGSMDTLKFTELNRITRFNSRIAAESGTLYEVRWDFEAGPDTAAGKFEVSYEDLKVQLSSSGSPDTTGVLKDVGSYLANLFVVNSSIAEGKSEEPKEVEFEQERDKERSFFNYYVKSLLAGLMVAIGVPLQ